MRPSVSRGRRLSLFALVLAALLLLLGGHPPAASAAPRESPRIDEPAGGSADEPGDELPTPPAAGRRPYLGAILDWEVDTPAAYRDRLGVAPAAFGYTARVPIGTEDRQNLEAALRSAHAAGAGLVVTLIPDVALSRFDQAEVRMLVERLEAAGVGKETAVWLRPMPEMNASWHEWGQQPTAYTRVFRQLAELVHRDLPRTALVWQPAYAAGYPFGEGEGQQTLDVGRVDDPALDTDGDGRLTYRDDAYRPYWPGGEAVDWVGLSLYHWGDEYPFGFNERPAQRKLLDQLVGTYGYPDPENQAERAFYQRFAERYGNPMLLETAALYSPGAGGARESVVKSAWLEQLADQRVLGRHPRIAMILWLEQRRPEAEALQRVVDWRVTARPRLARLFRSSFVERSDLTTGTPQPDRGDSSGPSDAGGTVGAKGAVLRDEAALTASGALGAVGLGLLVLATSRRKRSWVYQDDGPRDLRIDALRGVAICFVVIDHIDIPSLWQLLTHETIGPVTGAELFVALSGIVLGAVYGPRVTDTTTWYDAATRMWRRAVTLWATALVVVVVVYLFAMLPGLDASVLTTYTDQGTGGGGRDAQGRVYQLYAGFDSLADYPVPGTTLRDVLLLRMGPSQINIIGLYVILLLVAPLMTWMLLKDWWPALLAASAALYAANLVDRIRLLPSQFEDPFPLLSWQLLFVVGLVVGWHRTALASHWRRPLGRALVCVAVVTSLALALFAASSPYLSNVYDVRLALIPVDTFQSIYDRWFARTVLGPGRLIATLCVLVTGCAVLTRFWNPVERAIGWFLIPLGQATLYLFVMHVLLVVAVANVPPLTTNVWSGTLTHTAVLAALWVMVRRRFLFRLVPR